MTSYVRVMVTDCVWWDHRRPKPKTSVKRWSNVLVG